MRDIEDLHAAACRAKQNFYVDPSTGLHVFSAYHLSSRKCCGCGCRHCPYKQNPTVKPPSPSLLHGSLDDLPESIDVLFWSGGKDSFLALLALQRAALRPVVLLTTFDYATRSVAHQEVPIDDVMAQAAALALPLFGVPVGGRPYLAAVSDALERLRSEGLSIARLAFGDLHLAHVRQWRESELHKLDADLCYPLWQTPYRELTQHLANANVRITVSAVDRRLHEAGIRVGDAFNEGFLERLPPDVDRFGENGEFHTLVHIPQNFARQTDLT